MKKKQLLTLLLPFAFLQSCSHYYYTPNSNNVPILKEAGDVRFVGAISSSENSEAVEAQSAVAFTDHIAGMVNFLTSTDNIDVKSTFTEAAVGYYLPLSEERTVIFETYGGAGFGGITNLYSSGFSKVGVTRFFIQPSIGYSDAKGIFEAAVSSRVSYVNINVKNKSLVQNADYFDNSQLEAIQANGKNFYWEPSLVLRLGYKVVMAQFQYTMSLPFRMQRYETENTLASLGLIFSLPNRY
jgi:hypothetical protein